jgi:hypothetical protein
MIMRLKKEDITRLILACRYYKEVTGSEHIWNQYEELERKLRTYLEQYSTNE